MHLLFVALLGLLLSFLGQLPLGTISFTTTQIAVQENFGNAWKFSLGVAIMEILYLRLVLSGLDWLMQHQLLYVILGWLTAIFFIMLGILSLLAAQKQQKDQKAFLLKNEMDRFWLGITMSAFNPLQIPFWLLWSSYFMSLKLLGDQFAE
ncbi:MAG TPA: LysE family transporter, partial [Puia sp.]|nr:LysE family transporter [Puia sp.]